MIWTGRFLCLLALGAAAPLVIWLLGGSPLASGLGLLLFDPLLLLAAWIDGWRTERVDTWQIERQLAPRLMLGEPNTVEIRLTVPAGRALQLDLRDDFPPGLELVGARDLRLKLPRSTTSARVVSVGYQLLAPRRGEYHFGDLHIRCRSPWGLVRRQSAYPAAASCRVYPNLRQARREELTFRQLYPFRFGQHPTRQRGQGRDFETLRDYLPGDDLRDIAWLATARRGRLVTRQYRFEHHQRVVLLLDAGRLMTSRIDHLTKLDHAINAALSLSRIILAAGDQLGLLIFDQEVRSWLPPQRGPAHFQKLLEALYQVEARLVEPSHERACAFLSHVNPRRSLALFLTDVVDEVASAQLLTATASLLPRHLPLVVTIGDLDLSHLVDRPPTSVQEVYRQSVAEDLLHHRREALARIAERGALALDLPTTRLAPSLIHQYFHIRDRRLV